MTGFTCPICGGNIHEQLYEPIAQCDTCCLIIRFDGSWDRSEMDMENQEPDETALEVLYEQ